MTAQSDKRISQGTEAKDAKGVTAKLIIVVESSRRMSRRLGFDSGFNEGSLSSVQKMKAE